MAVRAELAAVLALAVALPACGRTPLPPRLAGLARSRIVTGQQAARLVQRLHGRRVATASFSVAEYGRRGQLRVWLARYRDFPTAYRDFQRMLDAMRRQVTPFQPPREDPRQQNRFVTVGNGAHHLLWVSGPCLYWLEGDPETLFAAAHDLPEPPPVHLL